MLPLIFKWVSPYSLLVSVLYTFGELNKNNEVISIRTAGISIFRLAFPAAFFSLLISFFALFIQENILMTSQKKVDDIKIQFIKKNISSTSEENDISFSSGNMILFIRKLSLKDKTLHDATIFKEDDKGNIVKKIICKTIVYENGKWVGHDAMEYTLDVAGKIVDKPLFLQQINIELIEKPQEIIFKKSLFSQFAPLKNLRKEIFRLKRIKAYDKLTNLIIDYHQKIVEPFSHFFLIIGIIPFALEIKKRHVALSSIGVGFIFGFIYYCFLYFSVAVGRTGMILPFFAPWLVPIFFLIVGTTGIMFVK